LTDYTQADLLGLEGSIREEVQHREVAHDDKAQEVVLPNSSPHGQTFSFFFITLGLELSDTKVYEP